MSKEAGTRIGSAIILRCWKHRFPQEILARLNLAISASLNRISLQIDLAAIDFDAFGEKHFLLGGQALGEAGQGAVAADDAMAGDRWGIGVSVKGTADGAVSSASHLFGNPAVGSDFAAGDAGGDSPDALLERHFWGEFAVAN
jgi:hypothetical protein